jgi:hypothetical protein
MLKRLKKQRPNSLLSSASALGLGVGFIGNASSQADDLQTIIPPQFYKKTEDGQVVLAATDGQRVILNEGQYLILEDGFLIITNELALNTLNSLSVLGSFRSSDFSFPDPVYSSSGNIIETASNQPLWSGDRPTFQSLGIETYEFAQNNGDQEGSGSSSNGSGIGNAGLGAGLGFGFMGLVNGFFGRGRPEEAQTVPTPQETVPTLAPTYSGPVRGFVINGIDTLSSSGEYYGGRFVSSAGDINRDGYDDIIIGAPYADITGTDAGASYVIFGKDSGYSTSLDLSSLSGADGFVINGVGASDRTGLSVSSAGDINKDGFDDIILGAIEPFILFGKSTGFTTPINAVDISTGDGSKGFVISGNTYHDYAGFGVSTAGDINGDDIDDIIIGALGAGTTNSEVGETYIVFGKDSGYSSTLDLANLDGTNGFVIKGAAAGDSIGYSTSSAGDINRDGYDDIIIGAPFVDTTGADAGASYIVFGKSGVYTESLELSTLDGTNGFVVHGVASGDFSGLSVSTAGDINKDGYDDMIIGAVGEDSWTGKSYVIYGKNFDADPFPASLNLSHWSSGDGSEGFVINGITANDYLGYSVSSAGDINGDDIDDIILGAPEEMPDDDAFGSGDSYVIFGKDTGYSASFDLANLDGTNGFVLNGIDTGDFTGHSVSSAGDINNDGFDDIIIGAPGAGKSYVVFGQSEFDAFVDLSDLALMV